MPPVVLERPKMSRPMWDALKGHIMRERERKKQELEADAEVERQRKERERQQKQHVLTLSETREQIGQMESRLSELKEEKHQLFLQLKKVLNEDETRRRQLMNQEAAELMKLHPFNNFNSPPRLQLSDHGGHHPQQIFMQPMTVTRTQTGPGVYKVGQPVSVSHHNNNNPSPHATMPVTGQIKRSRSPSPPPQSHNYKFGPFKPPPQAIPQYGLKPSMGMQYFHPQVQVSHNQQAPSQHGPVVSYSSVPHPSSQQGPQTTLYTYASAPPARSPQTPSRDESPKQQQQQQQQQQQHVAGPMYISHGRPIPPGYVIHQTVEHPNSSPHKFADDSPKYYPPPSSHGMSMSMRPPSHLHPGLSIQNSQNRYDFQNAPSGSITSGYPIRTQPNASSYQGRPPSPQVQYSVPGGPPRLTYGHPHGQVPQHPGVQRYSLPPGVQRD